MQLIPALGCKSLPADGPRRLGQAAWEPAVGLGARWGAFGREAPLRERLLPERVISPPPKLARATRG